VAEEPYDIIHEDEWLLAASKAAGIPSQRDKSGDESVIDLHERDRNSRRRTALKLIREQNVCRQGQQRRYQYLSLPP
jgi:23S rRNA-/tRNA-specific pseudouridylate synthase